MLTPNESEQKNMANKNGLIDEMTNGQINRVASIVEGTVEAQRRVEKLNEGLTLTRADVERSQAQMALINGQQKLLIEMVAELEQGIKSHKALLVEVVTPRNGSPRY
jgi:multidrug resistance efflux pump